MQMTSTTSTIKNGDSMGKEKNTEIKLVRAVKLMGGMAPKFVSPGLDGVPDRLVLLPGAKFAFAEIKADGKTMRPLQVKRKSSWKR